MKRKRSTPLRQEKLEPGHCPPALRQEILGNARYFRSLSASSLERVNDGFRAVHYAAGTTIYHEGSPSERLFFVAHGKVKLLHHSSAGDDVVLDILSQGALFGGLAVVGLPVHEDTAQAQTDCCVLVVTAANFQRMLEENPEIAVEVLRSLARDLSDARQTIKELTTNTVEERLARMLLKLADRFGEHDESGELIQTPLPQQDMAAMIGTTAESVSRVISSFKHAGYVDAGRQWVRVLDRSGLRRLAGASH